MLAVLLLLFLEVYHFWNKVNLHSFVFWNVYISPQNISEQAPPAFIVSRIVIEIDFSSYFFNTGICWLSLLDI